MKTLPLVIPALLWTGLAPAELQIQKVWPEKVHCRPGGRLGNSRRSTAVPDAEMAGNFRIHAREVPLYDRSENETLEATR